MKLAPPAIEALKNIIRRYSFRKLIPGLPGAIRATTITLSKKHGLIKGREPRAFPCRGYRICPGATYVAGADYNRKGSREKMAPGRVGFQRVRTKSCPLAIGWKPLIRVKLIKVY